MSKVLFVNGNLHGHFNPTLPIVIELVKRGEEVWYFSSVAFKDKILATGAHFMDASLEDFYSSYKPTGNHPFYTLLEYMIKYEVALIPRLLDQTKGIEFDYAICDSILGAGYFVKSIMKILMICSNTTFARNHLPVPDRMMEVGSHPQLDEFYRELNNTCNEYKIPIPSGYEFFSNVGDCNLVYTSAEFNSDSADFDDSFHFVGPSIFEREEKIDFPMDQIENEEVIYISLGTINTDFSSFYQLCMKALSSLDYKVVLSVGNKCEIESLGPIPDNFIVCQYAPQLEILKRTKAFISHGGFNSVSEALYFNVPMVVIPMANDQHMVAKRVVELGCGLSYSLKDLEETILKEAVETLLTQDQYRQSSERIGATLRKKNGYQTAAEVILEFSRGRKYGNEE
jgi:MGT family glycosyltransferase